MASSTSLASILATELMQPSHPESVDASAQGQRSSAQELDPLPPLTRILIVILGWLLILVGVAGLVLPGLQGVLTLLLGAACLSLVDHQVLAVLRRIFKRWPKGWRRLLRLRRKIHEWLAASSTIGERENSATDTGAPSEPHSG